MSWRRGSQLFIECWPHIRSHISDAGIRDDFTKRLVDLFSHFDMDPHDLIGLDPDLDAILGAETESDDPKEDIAYCISGLSSNDESIRKLSAEAILASVGQAGGSGSQEAANALLRACVSDSSDAVRVVALKSLREMVEAYSAVIGAEGVVRLTVSGSSAVSQEAEYVLRAIQRRS